MGEYYTVVVKLDAPRKHTNADSLEIFDVFGGYPCLTHIGDFKEGDLAAYLSVDALAPLDHAKFSFLKGRHEKTVDGKQYSRVSAMRLRGVFSMGLLVKADPEMKEGDDVSSVWGIQKYEPPEFRGGPSRPGGKFSSGNFIKDIGVTPVYDIDGYRKYKYLLEEGEEVWITEKVHGCSSKYIQYNDVFYAGSRNGFKNREQADRDLWWQIATKYKLEEKLKTIPNIALYGEVYGQVQDLRYGKDSHEFIAFDCYNVESRRWLNVDDFLQLCQSLEIPTVPTLYRGPWNSDLVSLAEGNTTFPNASHIREGCVIKPVINRRDERIGRVFLKLVGEGFLTRK